MAAIAIPAIAGLAGSVMDSGAKRDATQQGAQLTREQIAEASRQFNLLFDSQNAQRNDLTALAREDLNTRRGDASDMRNRMEAYIKQLLGETGSTDVFKKGGKFDATGDEGSSAIKRELLTRMNVDAPRQREDIVSAKRQLPAYEAELREKGPSAEMIAGLINKSGQAENADEFSRNRNAGAMALTRTGAGNGATSRLYSELAKRQASSRAQIATNAQLQGIQGAEGLATAKAQRLQPIISSLVGRSTKSPDAGLPDDRSSDRNAQLAGLLMGAHGSLASNLIPAGNISAGGMAFPQAGVGSSSPVQYGGSVKNNTPDATSYGSTVASFGDFFGDLLNNRKKSSGGAASGSSGGPY